MTLHTVIHVETFVASATKWVEQGRLDPNCVQHTSAYYGKSEARQFVDHQHHYTYIHLHLGLSASCRKANALGRAVTDLMERSKATDAS